MVSQLPEPIWVTSPCPTRISAVPARAAQGNRDTAPPWAG